MKAAGQWLAVLALALLAPVSARAQWTFDVSTVEAYINDHRTQRSLLLARSTLEQGNRLLHDYSRDETSDYKEINVDLDKYTRAFDVIDILYQSLRTALNVYSTYEGVSETVSDYKDMLSEYNEKVVKRKSVELADTLILAIAAQAIGTIADDCEYLYRSVSDLVLYATGAAACSTADLMTVLDSINGSLDNIESHLRRAYYETWRYIQLRIGYWKEKVYRTRTKEQIAADAFSRWRAAGRLDN